MQVPHRGTRGGEKARKRQFFEVSDQVRSAQRNLFRTVPWRRIEYSEATQALSQAFTAIAANPNDPSEPGWVVVATFNAALLAHLPAQQAGAPGGAAHGAPEADDDQPDPDAAAHDDQVDIGQDAEEAAPPDQAEPELEVPPRTPTEEELITLDHQILDDHLDIHDTGAEGQVQVGAQGQVQPGAVLEGAASGAPGEPGAEEEEQPEQDEYVEVEIDTPEGSIYSPLAPEEVEEEPEEEAASSSAYPAPTGRGPLSSRVPLVLKPALGVYPTVRIDSTGIWIRYSGPLSQPEPLTGPRRRTLFTSRATPTSCRRKPGPIRLPLQEGTRHPASQNRPRLTILATQNPHLKGQKEPGKTRRQGSAGRQSKRHHQTTLCRSVSLSVPVLTLSV